jgi:hypothetical protein
MLGGSLTLTHRRCGKTGCRCEKDRGHAMWTLTTSFGGAKDVLVVPAELLPTLKPLVALGREYRGALTEILAINAKLVRLWRAQQIEQRSRRVKAKPHRRNKR